MTESILQEAERIINGDRAEQYGDARQSFESIARYWSEYLGQTLEAVDVASLMILLKVARTKNGYHRDSYVDIAGYAGLTEKLVTEPTKPHEGTPGWASLLDVPSSVYVVYDAQGESWHSFGDQSYWARDSDETDTQYRDAGSFGPFTERPKNV
ncbi:DUF6378 domain-containing protein [Mycobacteroides chelonae]|uniref:DUF6378 domain-containing protein n=1 Tax=Mycobacteroides chelonae TaxID=1774 RepID=UPI0009924589|nr:DUF6378 domain-containing protein [Mycobacteroides chelonae]